MNTILLIVYCLVEAGLATFTFIAQREKKQWAMNRLLVNGVELVLYLLFLVLPGIDLGMRFKFLIIMLIVRLVIAGILYLIRRRAEGPKQAVWIILSGIASVLLLGVAMIPSYLFADYQGRAITGPYKVELAEAILIDESRIEEFETDGSYREVPVHFYFPADAGEGEKFPLAVFSHGAFGYYQSNTSTYMELASNGYMVVSLDHPYHSFFCKDSEGKLITVSSDFMNDVMQVNEIQVSEREILETSRAWLELRTNDISFVLDQIEAYNKNGSLGDSWYLLSDPQVVEQALHHVDVDRIGLMGHSLGGAASVSVGRIRDDVDAVINLDGTMLGEEVDVVECEPFTFEGRVYHEKDVINEDPYPVPLLTIDSVLHHQSRIDAEAVHMPYANSVVLQNATEGYETYIDNTAHMNFTDLPLFSPFLGRMLGVGSIDAGECVDEMNQIILAFYDAKLKDKGNFQVKESYGN